MKDKSDFLNIIHHYYPYKVDSIKQKEFYLLTKEYSNLIGKINEFKTPYPKEINLFIDELKNLKKDEFIFDDLTCFEWLDRGYSFEFKKRVSNHFILVKLYRSIIIPHYFIELLKIDVIDDRFRYTKIMENDFTYTDLIDEIKNICEKYNLVEIKNQLINSKIENVNFDDIKMGDFTFFNAFFNSQKIIL